MKKVAIVFHSGNGHTRELAKAVYTGVSFSTECILVEITKDKKCPFDIISQADAIIFGSPTYMGSVSAAFKNFMDQSGELWLKQPWKNKIAAGFTVATSPSGDKFGTLSAMMVFAMQHSMIWVGQDHVGSIYTNDDLELNKSGSWIGVMAQSNPDKSKLIFDGDKRTAIRFGRRIAMAVKAISLENVVAH